MVLTYPAAPGTRLEMPQQPAISNQPSGWEILPGGTLKRGQLIRWIVLGVVFP